MRKNNKDIKPTMSDKTTEKEQELDQEVDATTAEETAPLSEIELLQKELEETKAQLEHEKKEHLFTRAEFDNYRRRSIMEKGDIIKTASEKAMKDILPVVDDFERGLAAMKESDNAEALLEGIELIYNKFIKYLEQNGVKAIESNGADFNTEYHEAVALLPMGEEMAGKVIDTVSKGYTLGDKVIRYAKVAVGQ